MGLKLGSTIDAIGGGQKTINFLVNNNSISFCDILHLVSHIGNDEVGQLVETLGGPSNLIRFMTNLDLMGSASKKHVHTFVSFVEKSGGITRKCEALSNDANTMSEKLQHMIKLVLIVLWLKT